MLVITGLQDAEVFRSNRVFIVDAAKERGMGNTQGRLTNQQGKSVGTWSRNPGDEEIVGVDDLKANLGNVEDVGSRLPLEV